MRVVLEHQRARRNGGEALVLHDRPLAALDVDLEQVDLAQVREDVQRGNADRAGRPVARRRDVRDRALPADELERPVTRPGAGLDPLPRALAAVRLHAACEQARVVAIRLEGGYSRLGIAADDVGAEEADVRAQVDDLQLRPRSPERGLHLRRWVVEPLREHLVERPHVLGAVSQADQHAGLAHVVAAGHPPPAKLAQRERPPLAHQARAQSERDPAQAARSPPAAARPGWRRGAASATAAGSCSAPERALVGLEGARARRRASCSGRRARARERATSRRRARRGSRAPPSRGRADRSSAPRRRRPRAGPECRSTQPAPPAASPRAPAGQIPPRASGTRSSRPAPRAPRARRRPRSRRTARAPPRRSSAASARSSSLVGLGMTGQHEHDVARQLRQRAHQQLLVLVRALGRHAQHDARVPERMALAHGSGSAAGATSAGRPAPCGTIEKARRVEPEHRADLVADGAGRGDQRVAAAGGPCRDLAHAQRRDEAEGAVPEEGDVVQGDDGAARRPGSARPSPGCARRPTARAAPAPAAAPARRACGAAAGPRRPAAATQLEDPSSRRARSAAAPLRVVTTVKRVPGYSAASAGASLPQVCLRTAGDAGVEEERVQRDAADRDRARGRVP